MYVSPREFYCKVTLKARKIKRHKAKTLGQIRLLVNKHFGGDHTAKWQKSRGEVCVGELLRQVVNEQVAAFGSYLHIFLFNFYF